MDLEMITFQQLYLCVISKVLSRKLSYGHITSLPLSLRTYEKRAHCMSVRPSVLPSTCLSHLYRCFGSNIEE